MTPSVSIVIASHNYGEYVGQAIDSALAQDYPAAEVIVVDDGSTDSSPDIIHSYGTTIRTIFQSNRGQAVAWYSGFVEVSGDYVLFLDSDDRLLAHATSAIADAAVDSPAKIHWRMQLVGPAGQGLGIELPGARLPTGDRLGTLVSYGFDTGPNMPSSGNAWAARFLREVLPMPEAPFTVAADTFLLGLSPLFGPTAAIDRVCSQYRSHERNNGGIGSIAQRASDVVMRTEVTFRAVAVQLRNRGIVADFENWRLANPTYKYYKALMEPPSTSSLGITRSLFHPDA